MCLSTDPGHLTRLTQQVSPRGVSELVNCCRHYRIVESITVGETSLNGSLNPEGLVSTVRALEAIAAGHLPERVDCLVAALTLDNLDSGRIGGGARGRDAVVLAQHLRSLADGQRTDFSASTRVGASVVARLLRELATRT